jgi:hypothetical protein
MSDFPSQQKKDRYDHAANLISLPCAALSKTVSIAKRILVRTSKTSNANEQSEKIPLDQAVPIPVQKLKIANQVHSIRFNELTVCFYLYVQDEVIRISARKKGFQKEYIFTRAISDGIHAPFTMDSAVDWFKSDGFKSVNAKPEVVTQAEEKRPVAPVLHLPNSSSNPIIRKKVAAVKRPTTGKIVSFGETTRPGRDGKPPYTTYALTINCASVGEKEFIGEHLAELVASMNLVVGQTIRLHPLGKQLFTVVTNEGKVEERSRNEYAIDLI